MDKDATFKWLCLASDAARAAGTALLANRAQWNTVNEAVARDIKLRADREAEDLLLEQLKANSPFAILSEETGWHDLRDDAPQTFWVVDPLDGTANYASGIALCCTCVALVHRDKPVLGAIYDFNRDEMFLGAPGYGATLNGKDIHVTQTPEKASSILMTGFPVHRDFSKQAMERFTREAVQWKKVRMIGSAALSLAYVAAGRADAYHEEAIMLWDVAAGLAIIEAAGGCMEMQKTTDDAPREVAAGNGLVAVELSS